MEKIKFFIFILTFSIISFVGFSENNLSDDKINEFDFKSDKSGKSIFDKVQWKKIKEKNGITLYMQKNKSDRNNHYKAEKIISSNQGEKLYANLMDFDKYLKIFPKTMVYKKIKDISNGKYLMYCQANFKPLRNRDYYIILEYLVEIENNTKEWTIEWYTIGSFPEKFPEIKGFFRVKDIYGRWRILEKNNKIKISVELYNNFNLTVLKILSVPYEKSSTIDTLNQLVNYTIK